MDTEGHSSCTDSTLNSSSSVCKSVAYCTDSQLMCTWEKMVAGGDGLLSSPRQCSFSRELDILSANPSSCPQVFHRKPHARRQEAVGIVQVRAHARTVRASGIVSRRASHLTSKLVLSFRLPAYVAPPLPSHGARSGPHDRSFLRLVTLSEEIGHHREARPWRPAVKLLLALCDCSRESRHASIASTRQRTERSPTFTGFGKTPSLMAR